VTDDRQTDDGPRYGEMCSYRRNRLIALERVRLKQKCCKTFVKYPSKPIERRLKMGRGCKNVLFYT